jgi:diguanylate cyclase (GGDEF)-like protein
LRAVLFALTPVVVVAATVFASASIQSDAEQQAFNRVQRSFVLLDVWVQEGAAMRNYLLTAEPRALVQYQQLRREVLDALDDERVDVAGVPQAERLYAIEASSAQRWWRAAAGQLAAVSRNGPDSIASTASAPRSQASTAFESANRSYTILMEARRTDDIHAASRRAEWIDIVCVLLLALGAGAFISRTWSAERRRASELLQAEQERARAERHYGDWRRQYSQKLLASARGSQASVVIVDAIEEQLSGSTVSVARLNRAGDALLVVQRKGREDEAAHPLQNAAPSACAAIRSGAAVGKGVAEDTDMCQACGAIAGRVCCEPLIVAGRAIGAVWIEHPEALEEHDQRVIEDTVALGTPVLANLRDLALVARDAETDPLTELPNRRAMDSTFALMLAQAKRTNAPLSVILIDVDGFKAVNDTLGHTGGDALLGALADALVGGARASDLIARIGGDEFVALLPATDIGGAAALAAKLADAVHAIRLPGLERQVTASFGVASMPEHGSDRDALIHAADRALYQAKAAGRDRVCGASVEKARNGELGDPAADERLGRGAAAGQRPT